MKAIDALEAAVHHGVLPEDGRVVLGCSGGVDSMALVEAMVQLGRWSILVATVDHGLHPDSADQARFVTSRWGAEVTAVKTLRAEPAAIRRGEGLEDGARRERYRLLEETRRDWRGQVVVTAHTADDQAETMLMRLADGAGLKGLRGVHARRGHVVRPWLALTRAEVLAYATTRDVSWVEDPTNADDRFRRNRLRASAMPALATALGARWTVGAARTAGFVQAAIVDGESPSGHDALVFGRHRVGIDLAPEAGSAAIGRAALSALTWAVDTWTRGGGRGWSGHVEGLTEMVADPTERGPVTLPYGLAMWREEGVVWVGLPGALAAPDGEISLGGVGVVRWGDWLLEVTPWKDDVATPTTKVDVVSLDRAPFPWRVRPRREGDKYHRRGAPGRKRVARQWGDQKVPRALRPGLPIVESAEGIIWVGRLGSAAGVVGERGEGRVQVHLHWAPGGHTSESAPQWPVSSKNPES